MKTTPQIESEKRRLDAPTSSHMEADPPEQTEAAQGAQLVLRKQLRFTLDVNPAYLNSLTNSGEIGYWRDFPNKVPEIRVLPINCPELRRCMTSTLTSVLAVAYLDSTTMRQSDIDAEITFFVPIVVDVCMTLLYAKLRKLHRFYGIYPLRYTTSPYSRDIELPLPFALAFQDFGAFETVSLPKKYLYVPSYPENTKHEGRSDEECHLSAYLSYLPTLRELKIPLKSIDTHKMKGSPWWTYGISCVNNTVDLVCTVPPSMYSDFSAQLRMLFVVPTGDNAFDAEEIVTHPDDVLRFGVRAKELRRGIHTRTFMALSHFPSEWSFS